MIKTSLDRTIGCMFHVHSHGRKCANFKTRSPILNAKGSREPKFKGYIRNSRYENRANSLRFVRMYTSFSQVTRVNYPELYDVHRFPSAVTVRPARTRPWWFPETALRAANQSHWPLWTATVSSFPSLLLNVFYQREYRYVE